MKDEAVGRVARRRGVILPEKCIGDVFHALMVVCETGNTVIKTGLHQPTWILFPHQKFIQVVYLYHFSYTGFYPVKVALTLLFFSSIINSVSLFSFAILLLSHSRRFFEVVYQRTSRCLSHPAKQLSISCSYQVLCFIETVQKES